MVPWIVLRSYTREETILGVRLSFTYVSMFVEHVLVIVITMISFWNYNMDFEGNIDISMLVHE